ncbi:MAG: protein-export chaperone SecB, partial [Clostridium sp.]
MKSSILQFRNPILTKINYKVNNDFQTEEAIRLKINLETRINKNNDDNKALVQVKLKIFDKKEKSSFPFYMTVIMTGEFTWDEGIDPKLLDTLLKSNAPSIILSYIRPYVSTLTTGSAFEPLILPLLDL